MTVTRMLSISLFMTAITLIGVVEVLARRSRSVPTLGDICSFIMSYKRGRLPVGRVAVFGFWWWLGWHFFAR
jgi:hypothetical protein